MCLHEFQSLIDEQTGLVEIKLNGLGEALMQGDDYFEMIRYARARRIWVRMTTNASLLHVDGNYRKLIDSGVNEIDISVEFKQGPIKLYNVVADIKGTEKPDEYVIIGGHMDSWDGAEGCTDNGTGSATTIEAARLLMKAGAKSGCRPRLGVAMTPSDAR